MVKENVSHYRIIEKLGGGGMGIVYKAEDTRLHRFVALKFLPPELTRDDEAKERFIREAQAASALDHNNICSIHEIDETEDGQIFICMNCYEGETLRKKIENSSLKIEDAINIVFQIAEGLRQAHSKGIIHRDIKPENIFITDDGIVKIVDFGLAKLSQRSTITKRKESLGTISYMSPEQAVGKDVDIRTDIWSLGVVLYEILTGKLPFKGEYDSAVIYNILNSEPEPINNIRNDLPDAIIKIINKSLNKDANRRYKNADEFLNDLKELRQEPEHITLTYLPVKKINKKRIILYSSTIFAIILIVTLWLLLKGTGTDENKSIGVLPFVTFNDTAEDLFFADGMHEEITAQLSKISDLRVIARTSMVLYKNTKKRISDIGDELGVKYLLEGSIRRIGNEIRVTAQLINTETEGNIWGGAFEANEVNLFNIQNEIAKRISEELSLKILPVEKTSIEKHMTSNRKAYDFYLKGRYYSTNYVDSLGTAKAAEMFDSAAYYDNNFAEAYAWASVFHTRMYSWYLWDQTPVRLQKSKTSLDRAILLSSNLPEVLLAKGYYLRYIDGKKDEALKEYEAALKEKPRWAFLLSQLGDLYADFGNWKKAREMLVQKRVIDPISLKLPNELEPFYISTALREWDRAKREAEEYLSSHPEDPYSYSNLANLMIDGYGDLKTARSILEEGSKKNPNIYRGGRTIEGIYFWKLKYFERKFDGALTSLNEKLPPEFWPIIQKYIKQGFTYRAKGDIENSFKAFDSARVVIEKIITEKDDLYSHAQLAYALAGIGKKDEAISQIKSVIQKSSSGSKMNLWTKMDYEVIEVEVYMLLRMYSEAIDKMDEILKKPGMLSVWQLKLHPIFDPIRNNERFKKIIEKYS
ncbi:MAG TPA: protein kinase [Ignavibacteriaceae bacterium]|nr:protein kinase [Ignavibacteriaceae bacterium]